MKKLLFLSSIITFGLMFTVDSGVARPIQYCKSGIPPRYNPDEYEQFRIAKHKLESFMKAHGPRPTIFNNNEGVLPKTPSITYYEFDLGNDRAGQRGQHRAIIGADGAKRYYYYTDNHYKSFCIIR